MNLVQINERLKDLPEQVIRQYANGMNPEIPAYVALGELQRRERVAQQMATAQGAAQGPQPSIKEQIEQKAGLMAAQGLQQQQMMQQMAQQRVPGPVPAGTPQPVDQPEVAMASGGLAAVPVRSDMFDYAEGGIIAFSGGGQSLNERAQRQMDQKGSIYDPYFGVPAEERERMKREAALKSAQDKATQGMAVTESNAQALADTARARITELEQNREELTRKFGPRMYEQALGRAQQAVDAATARGSELMAEQAGRGQERVAAATPPPPFGSNFAAVNPADMMGSPAGLPAAAKAKAVPTGNVLPAGAQPSTTPRPDIPRPAAKPPAATSLQDALPLVQTGAPPRADIPVSADRAEVERLMREQARPAPTAAGIIGDVNALMPVSMQDEAMKRLLGEQRARADAREAAFKGSRPSGLDDLIRVFGQAGQSKGLSGLAPAYTSNQDRKRAEELAFQKQQDELLTAIESRGMAYDKDVFGARTGAMDKAQTLFGQSQKSIIEAATAKLGADQGRLDKQAQLNMQLDLKKFEMAQEERLKGMDLEQRERDRKTTAANNPAAQAAQYVALMQKSRDLREQGKPAEADKLAAQAADMLAFKGSSGTAGVGMGRNAIMERRQTMTELEKIIKDEGMMYSDAEKKQAAAQYKSLALMNASEGGASSGEVDKTNPLLK